ncbi:circularly permuted type 2 ATP-grasp protein [Propionibacteriaceae bacterium Y2011]|uniref:circularly permuted type 2 ATP-grasp protein n=1 Tax=Microlunatus sp. Y2014 TaxID=3418488 RepID=UPI003B4FC8E7
MTDTSYQPAGGHDESLTDDGTVRPGWEALLGRFEELEDAELTRLADDVARLLEDDGVTYTPTRGPGLLGPGPVGDADQPALSDSEPWRLDPLPLVVDAGEWRHLERGLAQRAELLSRILTDVYTEQRLLADGLLPPLTVFGHAEYLRPLVGEAAPSAHQLLLTGTDLGRGADGGWQVFADRTQAPSGAGYAMQNRRVISRVLPELYHSAHLFRLTPFFHHVRMGLVDAAPTSVEDPRVVVLSPGAHSETSFDQAFLASLLGFPLVEGDDLVVRDGRVWLESVDRQEPVDVIWRRIDADWADPLELRRGSKLGVTGLVDCVRAGTVSVVNSLGSGVLENPALYPYLPQLCRELLGEELRLPSVKTWWCGDETSRIEVLANLDQLVIRSVNRSDGPRVVGSELGRTEREALRERVLAEPHRFVGQELLSLSSAPAMAADVTDGDDDNLIPGHVVMRNFTVRRGPSYVAMVGGLAQVSPDVPDDRLPGRQRRTKDVWVVSPAGATPDAVELPDDDLLPVAGPHAREALVPRVLDDLYWMGRYAERAEDLLRLVLSVRHVAVEADFAVDPDGALAVLLQAITHLSATYPGFVHDDPEPLAELRDVVLDVDRPGTVARSLQALTFAAQGVRDQLSDDVWMVLAGIDRAVTALRAARLDRGNQLADSAERILSGLLALTGITSENMVHDAGWHLLDIGRGVERAQQVVALLRSTLVARRSREVEDQVVSAALLAAESVVTFRRRYPRGYARADVMELLVRDPHNPRSVAYQLQRIRRRLEALPHTPSTARPLRLVEALIERVGDGPHPEVWTGEGESGTGGSIRVGLEEWLAGVHEALRALSGAIDEQYLRRPLQPRSISFDDEEEE